MSGPTLAEHLLENRPKMKQLFMSGYTKNEITQQIQLDKDTGFMSKPVTIDMLADKVREILDS
jgi:FixJ family two-component response regulator